MRRPPLLALLCSSAAACVVPRSLGAGQTAALPATSEAEVSVAAGGAYASDTLPQLNDQGAVTQVQTVSLPIVEANLRYGLSETAAVNVHASSAGLQPGVAFALGGPGSRFVIEPQLGLGYLAQNADSLGHTYLDLLAGVRVLGAAGRFTFAAGYDFQLVRSVSHVLDDQTTESLWAHDVTVSVGARFEVAGLELRPELTLLWAPATSSNVTSSVHEFDFTGGGGFVVAPMLGVAAVGGFERRGTEEE